MKLSKKGFSLVELMVVLSVIGIMAAVAVPTFSSMIENIKYRSEVRSILSQLQKAKIDAVKTNSDKTIIIGTTARGYTADRDVSVTFSPLSIVKNAVYVDDGTDAFLNGDAIIKYQHPGGGRTLSVKISIAGSVSII